MCDFVEAHCYLAASIFSIILRASRRFIIFKLTFDRDKVWQNKKSMYFYGEDSIQIPIPINVPIKKKKRIYKAQSVSKLRFFK